MSSAFWTFRRQRKEGKFSAPTRSSDCACRADVDDAWLCTFPRQAHLNGKVAAALFAKADELFVKTPEVVKVDVVASRLL